MLRVTLMCTVDLNRAEWLKHNLELNRRGLTEG